MARKPRHDALGAFYHVVCRGVEKRTIFIDDDDREALLQRLARLVSELGFLVVAWALIGNHLHVVVRRGRVPLATLMHRLTGAYAQQFNQRHGRVGHLFQDRFFSRAIRDEADLFLATKYVLFNPVRHRITSHTDFAAFPWSMYGALAGSRRPREFEAVAASLAVFGNNAAEARARLRELLAETARELEATQLETLIGDACERHQISPQELRGKGRSAIRARTEICLRGVRDGGVRARDLAAALGLSRSAVYRAASARLVRANRDKGV
jgi:REP element-mobilizing transposase RayT